MFYAGIQITLVRIRGQHVTVCSGVSARSWLVLGLTVCAVLLFRASVIGIGGLTRSFGILGYHSAMGCAEDGRRTTRRVNWDTHTADTYAYTHKVLFRLILLHSIAYPPCYSVPQPQYDLARQFRACRSVINGAIGHVRGGLWWNRPVPPLSSPPAWTSGLAQRCTQLYLRHGGAQCTVQCTSPYS